MARSSAYGLPGEATDSKVCRRQESVVHLILLATPGHLDELLLLPPVLQPRVEVCSRQAEEALVLVRGGSLGWGWGSLHLAL